MRQRPGRSSIIAIPTTVFVAMLGGSAAAQATPLRDPTQPPAAYGAQPVPERDAIGGFRPQHLVTVDGQRYLVWQGRRYRVGDSVQGARIERIDDTEVWVRTHEGVRKLPLFAGIEKRPPRSGAPATMPGRVDATKGKTE
jgi:hypothetical protein